MLSWSDIDAPPGTKGKILHGEHPTLIWPGKDCPVSKGDEIALVLQRSECGPVPQVWITVSGITYTKKGESLAHYSVRDDRPLFLASATGYTRSADRAIDKEASVDDPEAQVAYSAQARLQNASKRVDPRKRERRIKDRLRAVLNDLKDDDAEIALLADLERSLIKAQESSKATL